MPQNALQKYLDMFQSGPRQNYSSPSIFSGYAMQSGPTEEFYRQQQFQNANSQRTADLDAEDKQSQIDDRRANMDVRRQMAQGFGQMPNFYQGGGGGGMESRPQNNYGQFDYQNALGRFAR